MTSSRPMNCRLCHRPLEAPDRLRGMTTCRRAACLGRNEAARIEARRQQMTEAAMATVQAMQPASPVRQAVWLLPFGNALVATQAHEREAFRAALQPQAEQAARELQQAAPPAAVPQAAPTAAAAGTLCAHCGGRCCTAGRDDDAFLHDGALQRWLAAHPGQPPEAAVRAYVDALPPEHVEGSCLFHTAQGCALPREARGDTCNRYGCVPYRTLEGAMEAVPPQGVVVLRARGRLLESAALISPEGDMAPFEVPLPD